MYKSINNIMINVEVKICYNILNSKKCSLFNVSNLNYFGNDIKKNQKTAYLRKLNDDKKYFFIQYSLKKLGNDLKIIKILLFLQKKVQFFTLFDKVKKDKFLSDFNVDNFYNIKNQVFQSFLFKQSTSNVDIFPTEDILLHTNVIQLLTLAVVKGIFDLYLKVLSLDTLNKFSFIVYYETFDGNANSSVFPGSFVLTKNDASLLENFYLSPEKVSFFSSITNFILYLTEKYEGTSFYKISVIHTCIKWSYLKKAFNSKNI